MASIGAARRSTSDRAERPIHRIAVDTLGADAAPELLALGALDLAEAGGVELTLVGDAAPLRELVGERPHRILDASRAITNDDSVRDALRGKIDSSMRRAIALVASGTADAVVSAGNTGALMALARHLLPRLPGVDRPAIVKPFVGRADVRCWVLDLGANLSCTAEQMHGFARMGSAVAEATGGVAVPRIGVLNVGVEHSKGPREVRRAAELIAADEGLAFAGFVEANELFDGKADVVVCDGFAGNVALKATEGAASMARHLLGNELGNARLARVLLGRRLRRLAAAYNPQAYNGATFVGLRAVVVKSHGGADRTGFREAVGQAVRELDADLVGKVGARFATAGTSQ